MIHILFFLMKKTFCYILRNCIATCYMNTLPYSFFKNDDVVHIFLQITTVIMQPKIRPKLRKIKHIERFYTLSPMMCDLKKENNPNLHIIIIQRNLSKADSFIGWTE